MQPTVTCVVLWNIYTEESPYIHWYFQIVVLEETLESPLDCKEIKPVDSKGNQPWILIGRTDTEAEDPILWLPDAKSQLFGKDPDAGKGERKLWYKVLRKWPKPQ